MATTITITNGYANLPARIPHLMPFHIQHTGPAPISTYFRIRPHVDPSSPSSVSETHPPSGDSQTELTRTTANTEVDSEEKENALVTSDPPDPAASEADVDMDPKTLPSPALPTGPI